MKRTPERGVKENLKPVAYKQSEGDIILRGGRPDGVPFGE